MSVEPFSVIKRAREPRQFLLHAISDSWQEKRFRVLRQDLDVSLRFPIVNEFDPYLWSSRPLLNHLLRKKKIESLMKRLHKLDSSLCLYIPQGRSRNDLLDVFGSEREKSNRLDMMIQQGVLNEAPIQTSLIDRVLGSWPRIGYKTGKIRTEQGLKVVTGVCPLSGRQDEFTLEFDSRSTRLTMGYGRFSMENRTDIRRIVFPPRPLLSDWILLKRAARLAASLGAPLTVWLPHEDYWQYFSDHFFHDLFLERKDLKARFQRDLAQLCDSYELMIRALVSMEPNIQLELIRTNYDSLDEIRNSKDLFLPMNIGEIYGAWRGNKIEQSLYMSTVLEHIIPGEDAESLLHLESSYEIWPNLLAAELSETAQDMAVYSFLLEPALPGLHMSWMRDYNAPRDEKIFILEDEVSWTKKIGSADPRWIKYAFALMDLGEADSEADMTEMSDCVRAEVLAVKRILED